MNIILIGTGNVATVLGQLLFKAGHKIKQVYGRTEHAARHLASELNSAYCTQWEDIESDADIYIAALSDSFLYNLHHHLHLKNELIVHTAGSVSRDVLQNISSNYGVLYPLQSLHSQRDGYPPIPLMIDANSTTGLELLQTIARSISGDIEVADDLQRLKFHLAAVMVNNFTNHLYAVAENYCHENDLSFRHLLPLIHETVNRIEDHSPANVQTGPAVRHDEITIRKHIELLSARPAIQRLYLSVTDSIREFYKK